MKIVKQFCMQVCEFGTIFFFRFQILSEAFIDCHKSSTAAGTPFALKVFISGRNRLENEGAKALSKAFKVCLNPFQLKSL